MNLIKTMRTAVKAAAKGIEQSAVQAKAEVAQQAPKARDAFLAAARPKVELRADLKDGLEASAHVGDVKLASFTFGPAGIRLSDGNTNVDLGGPKGLGASTHVVGRELGVHFKTNEGAATLGAVDVEIAGREVVMGLAPAAPSPLPMVVYAGKDRDGEG